ncbi:heat shock protein 30 [Laetiporus sulphureus 93-53]|uniref:Heat shock protein 30 n=1 Tax=Laetiporus sulphureus 93-53 TaxID=1314785 RepID=A0A165FVR7_9APHY|nr:heat shock protein 30 [Laetiporus sulphureus 93-53]KZT09473.1 heat shock protein 30 [Laetiporus sulphureus 93-53]
MGNNALKDNPPGADLHISTNASDWLWAAFCVQAVSLLVMLVFNFARPRGTRLFHQLSLIILIGFSVGYFSMASNLGYAPAPVEFRGHGDKPTRQIWYVRYIVWTVTFPLSVLELLLATGLSLSDIVTTCFMCIVVIVMGLVGAIVLSTYKWGYFVFGIAGLFYVWYVLLWHGVRTQFPGDGVLRPGYIQAAGWFAFILITYPICWACSEGGNVITPSAEMIWYGILDICAGPIFLFFYLFRLHNVDYATFGFSSGKYTDSGAVVVPSEKPPVSAA